MVDKNGSNISINDVVVYVDGIGTNYIGIVIDFVNDKLIKIKIYNYTIIVKATDTYLADKYNPYIETVNLTKLSWGILAVIKKL